MTKERVNGLIIRLFPNTYSVSFKRVADLRMKNHLPFISSQSAWTDSGGLMSYGADLNVMYRRAATYVDKILKGAKAADLPIEAPTKFDLAINLKTAKQIGLMIPQRVLLKANRVIK
jgi:putative ABC transport system substrate-binding protein